MAVDKKPFIDKLVDKAKGAIPVLVNNGIVTAALAKIKPEWPAEVVEPAAKGLAASAASIFEPGELFVPRIQALAETLIRGTARRLLG
jgi:hypothetical protein